MKQEDTLLDFITGRKIPNIGSEMNRQAVERFLVEEKGFTREEIRVDTDISLDMSGEVYCSQVDLVVRVDEKNVMLIKCCSGSISSHERETLAAARLLDQYQIPLSVISDGKSAVILDTISGKKLSEGLETIPSKKEIYALLKTIVFIPYPEERKEREKLIFRSYDEMNVNVARKQNRSPL
ncbi:MAG: type I restriction enzyme HsdR N-terminal domain-containing protein [Desulfobacterales bacterium]